EKANRHHRCCGHRSIEVTVGRLNKHYFNRDTEQQKLSDQQSIEASKSGSQAATCKNREQAKQNCRRKQPRHGRIGSHRQLTDQVEHGDREDSDELRPSYRHFWLLLSPAPPMSRLPLPEQ